MGPNSNFGNSQFGPNTDFWDKYLPNIMTSVKENMYVEKLSYVMEMKESI